MFASFLNRLFGSRNPDELVRERMDAWQDWLRAIPASPSDPGASDGNGVGRDPGYEDAFFAIKDEIGRLSNVDERLIVRCCEQLLKEVGKDLRLAAYYTFARLRLDGGAGFADGIELTAALVERFGEALLPGRAETRKGALEWLANARLLDQLPSHEAFADADLKRAAAALNLLVTRTAQWPAAARPVLQPLVARFEQNDADNPAPVAQQVGAHANGQETAAAQRTVPVAPIASGRDLLEQARAMAQYLRKQERGYLSSVRLIRCVRWDTIHDLPPADSRLQTRLQAPRPELRQQLKRLLIQKQWHELLERVEGAFTEAANHLWLDLQFFQHTALEQLRDPYDGWGELLRSDFALMLERLSGLERLAFNDGTPFADDLTLDWIARHAVVRNLEAGEAMAPLSLSGGDTAAGAAQWQEIEAQARELLINEGLDAVFSWLQGLPGMAAQRQQFLQRWLMARLAEQAGRGDIAQHLMTQLNGLTAAAQLTSWEPALVFDVKHQLLRLLRQAAVKKDANRDELEPRVRQLAAELTVLDPLRSLSTI